MSHKTETLSLIRSCLPGRDLLIERAHRDNRGFRELCHDYRECVAAVERWKQHSGADADLRLEEYSELLTELSQEIETWLEAIDARVGS
jgi:hypothetical protein